MIKNFCRSALFSFMAGLARADELSSLPQDPKQWVAPGGNDANWRHSALTQITPENVGKLRPAWSFSTGVLGGHEGAPLVVGETMYIVTPFPNTVYALNLKQDGEILWSRTTKQEPEVPSKMCCDAVNRGLAYGDGKIFLSQADTTLSAFDAKTGRELWSMKNGDPARGETSSGAPHVFKDKVLIGVSGGEFGVRGHVTAYDVKKGRQLWRGYSTGPDAETLIDSEKTTHLGKPVGKEASLASWQKDQWKIGGGTTWGWFSYDPELNLVYYGTGNPAPGNPRQRPGDNRWASTIFVRDLDTGAVKWLYQMTPHDEWDFDGVGEMILVDREIDGVLRKTLVHFDKNGFVYVLDRASGELLSADKFDPSVNWASRIDIEKASPSYGRPLVVEKFSPDRNGEDVNTQGICPSTWGAKGAQPASYAPDVGMFYVPTAHMCMDYEPFRVPYVAGERYVGSTQEFYPPRPDGKLPRARGGAIVAWDERQRAVKWRLEEHDAVWSGVLTTGGGLAFYGTVGGYLKAVDIKTGEELYRYKTGSGIVGDIVSYEFGGKQFIAVFSGLGGRALFVFGDPNCYRHSVICENFYPRPHVKGGLLTVFEIKD